MSSTLGHFVIPQRIFLALMPSINKKCHQNHFQWLVEITGGKLNVLCVPCKELVRLTCGTPPGNSVLTVTCPVDDRSQQKSCLVLSHLVSDRTDINGYIPDTYRMPNAREPDKPHTNAQVTFIHRTSLSGGVRSMF